MYLLKCRYVFASVYSEFRYKIIIKVNAIIDIKFLEVFPEKSGAGGLAFNVVLAPAIAEISPRSPSPPKDRSFSQEAIEKKLKDAEERRLVRSFTYCLCIP